jgi:hypothetical protein
MRKEHHMGVGSLFEELADETAAFTYAHRILALFLKAFSK